MVYVVRAGGIPIFSELRLLQRLLNQSRGTFLCFCWLRSMRTCKTGIEVVFAELNARKINQSIKVIFSTRFWFYSNCCNFSRFLTIVLISQPHLIRAVRHSRAIYSMRLRQTIRLIEYGNETEFAWVWLGAARESRGYVWGLFWWTLLPGGSFNST